MKRFIIVLLMSLLIVSCSSKQEEKPKAEPEKPAVIEKPVEKPVVTESKLITTECTSTSSEDIGFDSMSFTHKDDKIKTLIIKAEMPVDSVEIADMIDAEDKEEFYAEMGYPDEIEVLLERSGDTSFTLSMIIDSENATPELYEFFEEAGGAFKLINSMSPKLLIMALETQEMACKSE
ncbi:hypothetical protein G7062_02400 [Erysipelothrix sp. HDW6C]|uniref:hypothetical protein n=1 Tax=Erysipelothrix sp. HDW6C TaxID=2714930 RepID=UPI00140DB8A4|nr:hypothetical protein [Erysipelothrix sp. HDW6C]QIK69208.1 hypothetical protein G7062_02400 [Erysipelothrix sp. HDW6C]